jgi:hypothetical protein
MSIPSGSESSFDPSITTSLFRRADLLQASHAKDYIIACQSSFSASEQCAPKVVMSQKIRHQLAGGDL